MKYVTIQCVCVCVCVFVSTHVLILEGTNECLGTHIFEVADAIWLKNLKIFIYTNNLFKFNKVEMIGRVRGG